MKSQIVTFSSLMKKVEEMFVKNPAAYYALTSSRGTEQLIDGACVWLGNSGFILRSPRGRDGRVKDGYCWVRGHKREGRWITVYKLEVSRTKFPKKVVERYLPFQFPAKGPASSKDNYNDSCGVTLLNSDGTSGKIIRWESSARGFGDFVGPAGQVAIDDLTGQLVHRKDLLNCSNYECEWPWFPESCLKIDPWLGSFSLIEGADYDRMRELAMRCLKSAASLSKMIPDAKVRVFPATTKPNSDRMARWGSRHRLVVVGREKVVSIPEVVLYWPDFTHHLGHTGFAYLNWQIPPHGIEYLYPKPGDCSVACEPDWGHRRAYHGLRAKAPGVTDDDYKNAGVTHEEVAVGYHPNEWAYADWGKLPDHVRCGRSGYAANLNVLVTEQPYAMEPEGMASFVEERVTMNAMPLC